MTARFRPSRAEFDASHVRASRLAPLYDREAVIAGSIARRLGCDGYLADSDLTWLQELFASGPTLAGQPFLDLGCGRGWVGPWLAGASAIAVDFSVRALLDERRRPMPTVCADIGAIPVRSASVVGALSIDALYLAGAPRSALTAVAAALVPGGYLAFTLFDDGTATRASDWLQAAPAAGFAVLSCHDTTDRWRHAMRAKHSWRLVHSDSLLRTFGSAVSPELAVSERILDGWLDSVQRLWLVFERSRVGAVGP
jgi:SAM-dependent methyltransferase